jgi:hypothetical protein
MCSQDGSQCRGDQAGAAVYGYGPPGLTFVIVEGETSTDTGEYQLSLIY